MDTATTVIRYHTAIAAVRSSLMMYLRASAAAVQVNTVIPAVQILPTEAVHTISAENIFVMTAIMGHRKRKFLSELCVTHARKRSV